MKRASRIRTYGPIARAIAIISAVGIITTGVTFALLQSQTAALTGNTIESATAGLQVSKDGGSYTSTTTGFDFKGIIPGGPAVPSNLGGYPLWLGNNGSAPLFLRLAMHTQPQYTDGIDLSKVMIILTPIAGSSIGTTTQQFSPQALLAADTTGGLAVGTSALAPNSNALFHVQVSMTADAFSGQSFSISSLDLLFSGVATN